MNISRILVMALSFVFTLANAEEKIPTLNFCAIDIANPPFYLFASSDPASPEYSQGLAFSLMSELELQTGLKINIHRRPWKRCLFLVKSGELDAVLGSSYVEDREAFGRYPKDKNGQIDLSRRLYSSHYWLFTNNQSVTWDGNHLQIPKGSYVGAGLGFSSARLLRKLKVDVQEEYSPAKLAMLLSKGRLSAVAGYSSQIQQEINRLGDSHNITRLPTPLTHDDMFLMFSIPFFENQRALAESIWDVLGNLNSNGRYQELEKQALSLTENYQ